MDVRNLVEFVFCPRMDGVSPREWRNDFVIVVGCCYEARKDAVGDGGISSPHLRIGI